MEQKRFFCYHRGMIAEKITDLIGNTPIVRVHGFGEDIKLYAKLEYFNPFSSAKDRVAYYMLKKAEERKEIDRDTLIIEPTSGNTGIALSAIASAMGYECLIVMPESMSLERRAIIKALGAKLVLTPASLGIAGSVRKAEEIKKEVGNAYIPDQFNNMDNRLAHYETTGPEILRDLPGIDCFVSAFGTGGTVSGVGRYLKEKRPGVEIVAVEPEESPLVTKGKSGSHKIQGIGANFIPSVLDFDVIDRFMTVKGDDAVMMSRKMMRRSGIFAGISSGAAMKAALEIAAENKEKTVLAILPDTAERYLSSVLFEED